MNRFELSVMTDVDPVDLAVNLRFRNSQVIHPRVRSAQDKLITLIKQAIPDDYEPPTLARVGLVFWMLSNRQDIDGPIKRTLDAIEKAVVAKGHDWNDRRIVELHVKKMPRVTPKAGVDITMTPAYPGDFQ